MDERRKLERFNLTVPTRLVITDNNKEEEVFEIKTCDICAGGAQFKTKYKIPEGSKVTLHFVLPLEKFVRDLGSNSYLTIKGKVIRTDSEGIAVVFSGKYKLLPYRNL
jgi:hypothetical protein